MSSNIKHNVVFAASEVMPFAKTGGLADVVGSLPRALAERGHRCTVILPLYRSARLGSTPVRPTPMTLTVPIRDRQVSATLWKSKLPSSDVAVYFIDQPDYFDRDDAAKGRGLYQYTIHGQKVDYPDNCERFVYFSRAILEAIRVLDLRPNILHLNDWQTGLAAVHLRETYWGQPLYHPIRTLLTIHNIAYQGTFWQLDMPLTGLDQRLFNSRQLEYYGGLSFLKGGLVFADMLNTVSPTYAHEISTSSEYGRGLEGVLAERRDRLFGIVNGVDYNVWNPAIDSEIEMQYDAESFVVGKRVCKAALQRRLGLRLEEHAPLLGVVSRLVEQKGIGLIIRAAETFLHDGAQMVVLGEGDWLYQQALQGLASRFPGQVAVELKQDEALAHQIEAGADIYLMPSQYEPCGLNQLYSLKYGAVPVVRTTGGLVDTVTDTTKESVRRGTATGFAFGPHDWDYFLHAVQRAIFAYRHAPDLWQQLIRTGMTQDWSWDHSAGEYEGLYARLRGM